MAAAALEEALRRRPIDLTTPGLVVRRDTGLVFGAKAFVTVARRYGLPPASITPYTPPQNGMIARFVLTLTQECVWLHRVESRDHASRVVADWLDRDDTERPHSALGYRTPKEYRVQAAACGVQERGGHHRTASLREDGAPPAGSRSEPRNGGAAAGPRFPIPPPRLRCLALPPPACG